MHLESNILIIIWFSFLLISVNANIGEVGNQTLFSYESGAPNGPENWGNFNHPEWRLCGSGQSQSPIDILSSEVKRVPSLGTYTTYRSGANALLRNRGHNIQVEYVGDVGGIVINDAEFKLRSCHWHTPSEHTIDGTRFSMELHLVHSNEQGDFAVLGILYNVGTTSDPFLELFTPLMSSATESGITMGPGFVLTNPEFPPGSYFRYSGSLTTPPCSENITWTLYADVGTVSQSQIQALKLAVGVGYQENARPVQPLNGRDVYAEADPGTSFMFS